MKSNTFELTGRRGGNCKTVKNKSKKNIKWGQENIVSFEKFQNYELLWIVRNVDYANKTKSESSILKLIDDLSSQYRVVLNLVFLRVRMYCCNPCMIDWRTSEINLEIVVAG